MKKTIRIILLVCLFIAIILSSNKVKAASSSISASATTVTKEEYTVKEGDTLESIIIRFYGTFDMDKVNLIQEANKMANPNALSIGQKLIIPVNKG